MLTLYLAGCTTAQHDCTCVAMSIRRAWSRVWGWYVRTLDSRPLLTQATTTGFVCGLGDVIAQSLIEKRRLRNYNVQRTATMTAIGFLFTGPVLRTWFISLDRLIGPSLTTRDALKKVFLDQVIFAPALFAILLPLFGFSQGMNTQQVKDKVSKEYFNMLLGFYKLWPAAQLVNFYIIPLKFRVNFSNIVSLFWNTYVSWLANRPVHNNVPIPPTGLQSKSR